MRPLLTLGLFIALLPLLAFSQTSFRDLSAGEWTFKKKGEKKWHSAVVPGSVHTDLLHNKLIPDPFYADNEKRLQWVDEEEWEYRSSFSISKEEILQSRPELVFEGLDTYASVYLNDSLILEANNMYRSWRIAVKKYLREGSNHLFIRFKPAVGVGKAEARKLPYTLPGEEKVFTRKAAYHYGWDWGPRFVTCGIWKPVRLCFWNQAAIRNLQTVQRSLSDSLAELDFVFEMEVEKEGTYELVSAAEPGLKLPMGTNKLFLTRGWNEVRIHRNILQPRRWWSRGLGEPVLYPYRFRLNFQGNLSIV